MNAIGDIIKNAQHRAMWGGQSCLQAGLQTGLSGRSKDKPTRWSARRQDCPPHIIPQKADPAADAKPEPRLATTAKWTR